MASQTIAARTTHPQFQAWTKPQRKMNSPYGAPVQDECTNCELLRRGNSFCGVSPASLEALQRIKHTNTFPTGAIIFMEGQAPRGVYILCQGRAKLMTTNSDGRTLILKIAEPGEALGLNSVITGQPHDLTVEILQPSQLAFIAREEFLRFIGEHGDACLHFAQHLSRDCQAAYDVIRSIGLSQSAPERLARFLLDWASHGHMSEGVLRVKLALTHEEMGQLIGSSRETVTRTLSEFRKQHIAEMSGSTLLVRNKPALESLAAS